jgi:hypothetical protein
VASSSTREIQEGRDDASSAAGSASAQGWDVEQDLVDQLSNHGLNANGGGGASASRHVFLHSYTAMEMCLVLRPVDYYCFCVVLS